MRSNNILLKDGKETSVDFKDTNINVTGVPLDFLSNVFVGRCPDDGDDCSRHGGKFTDINIWSRALTKQEMLDWTMCK